MGKFVVISIWLIFYLNSSLVIGGQHYKGTDGNKYYISYPNKYTWCEGNEKCQSKGMVLVELHTTDDHDTIMQFLQLNLYKQLRSRRFWIGANNFGNILKFQWDDSKIPIIFGNWGRERKVKKEKCVEIRGGFDYQWFAANCTRQNYIICRNPGYE